MKVLTRTISVTMLLAAVVCAPLLAQDAPQQGRDFCENNQGFSDWDFWVGEWQVFTNDEAKAHVGNNSITKHYANCLIKETWVDISGNGGFSINYYNPVREQWRQVWVSHGYSIDYAGGLNDQGQMVLEGEIDNYQPGTSTKFRGIWTPEESGDVIQRFEAWDAENDEWKVWFEGRYVKQSE